MAIAAFDIGGTSVKYGLWSEEGLGGKGSFATPESWEEMRTCIKQIFQSFAAKEELTGAAFSFPGAVDAQAGIIRGFSAVPYIHHFPIKAELERELGVPVSLENDANCAALAEVWQGAAAEADNVLFVVIGTGIGGAVIVNRQLVKGINLFGGEFGYMLLDGKRTFSQMATPVNAAARYSKRSGEAVDGVTLFRRAEEGDQLALEEVQYMQDALALGIHNLLVCFNPDRVVIGGAISTREDLIEQVAAKTEALLQQTQAGDVEVHIVPCQFRNDANLVGAVAAFESNA